VIQDAPYEVSQESEEDSPVLIHEENPAPLNPGDGESSHPFAVEGSPELALDENMFSSSSGPSADVDPLDRRMLDNIRELQQEGDADFLAEIIDIFLHDSAQTLEDIHQAAQRKNAEALRLSAHNLKGNSANLGAAHLAQICFELEKMGRAKDLRGKETYLEQLDFEYARVCQALTLERERKGA
jgi:HPt (histidine-containing phosphotransfer) domain-containing protein